MPIPIKNMFAYNKLQKAIEKFLNLRSVGYYIKILTTRRRNINEKVLIE